MKKTTKKTTAELNILNLEWAFNEWMRRFIKNPEQFAREFESVGEFQKSKGKPSYGKDCVAYVAKLLSERAAKRSKRGAAR